MHQGNFICYFHYTHTCEALEPERGKGSKQDSIIIMNESINNLDIQISSISVLIRKEMI